MRKALVLFGNEIERDALIDTVIYLKRSLGFKIEALYVRDVDREKIMTTPDGLIMAGRVPLMLQGWDAVEQAEMDSLKKCFKDKGLEEELVCDIGNIVDVVTDHMKTCDMLVIGKNDILGEREINILKGNYKTMLLIGDRPLQKMEKIYIGNDDGVKVNRSCYHFIHLFPEITEFHSFVINRDKQDKNQLIEYMEQNGKKVYHGELNHNKYEDVLAKVDEADIFIMGNLSRNYFLEKIVGKNGVKLLEKGKAPIFIG
ncbi:MULTISPECIES: hypothetical protein [Fusobacterium]|jgi:hypothetical protein|uniref:Universal stress protein n=1 Tax=Fusobacterium hominis TaxID=2764326 RepID=A0A7G9GVH3_9FUSO|nr:MULTISPECIES: hypothetical protein [Fusobacterium]QNM14805.1 hypothetical protein H9Q81_07525 [Fusobacterium hominis]